MSGLQEWVAQAEALGEVKTLRGVDWNLEIGVIAELVSRQRDKPAVLFDEIPGYPPGYRVLVNSLGSRQRFAMTMGFPRGLGRLEMLQEWRRRSRDLKLLPPRVVDSGPVMENTAFGEEVDVLKFPVPFWHELDGGRYIGTGDVVITQTPDGGWVNLGTYRLMVHDRSHVGLEIARSHHGSWHIDDWRAQGKPMPVAVAVGADPLLFMVGCSELPAGVGEYDYAGGIRGTPIDVIKGPVTGLPIPAHADIVIEGFVDPREFRAEGPHGEFMGYYAAGARPEPYIRIEGLYHRNNPILLGAPTLKPTVGGDFYVEIFRSILFWDALEAAGVPDVTGVICHVARSHMIVISLKQRYPGHAKQAGRIVSQLPISGVLAKYSVVVDEDIDVTDIDEVLWAMCTRVDPDRDIDILRGSVSSPLNPMIPPELRGQPPTASRVVIDATRPYEWRERFPEVVASSPELRQQVLGRWGEKLKGII